MQTLKRENAMTIEIKMTVEEALERIRSTRREGHRIEWSRVYDAPAFMDYDADVLLPGNAGTDMEGFFSIEDLQALVVLLSRSQELRRRRFPTA